MALKKSERRELIDSVVTFIQMGRTKHTIIQQLTKSRIPRLSNQVATNVYDCAVEEIRYRLRGDKEESKDIILAQYDLLYQEAYEAKKHGVCMGILDKKSELLGLKTTNINVTGEVSETTAMTLIEQLQVIMITFDKGMGNVIDQSIAAAIGIQDQSQSSDPSGV